MWTPTTFTRDETNCSKASDKESDLDSLTDQSSGTFAECSTVTSQAISWEEPLEQGDTQDNRAWANISKQAVHSPRLADSQAMILHPRQLERLQAVLNSVVIINGVSDVGSPPLPTLACRPIDFLDVLLRNLALSEIPVSEVRLFGGAASWVISESSSYFNDIDLMIHVDFNAMAQYLYMDGIKCVVLMSLREIVSNVLSSWCPTQIPTGSILDDRTLTRTYIAKMFRQLRCDDGLRNDDNNIWSLFSFNNFQGRNIEVKFVHTLKRQYTFSIDSWQIDLSNFLRSKRLNNQCVVQSNRPSAICYCLFPDLKVAYEDVKKKRIRVVEPETVRGGCFLRYGGLVYKGYKPASNKGIIELELVMLNRFLLDFSNPTKQSDAVDGYLRCHMGASAPVNKLFYIRLLELIVDRLKDHVGADNFPNSASTLACVIKEKVQKLQSVCKVSKVSKVVPQLSLTRNHMVQRRFCCVQNVRTRSWRQPTE